MKSKIHNKKMIKKQTWFARISLVPGWAPQARKSDVSHLSPGSYRTDGSIVTCKKQTYHLFQMITKIMRLALLTSDEIDLNISFICCVLYKETNYLKFYTSIIIHMVRIMFSAKDNK